MIWDLISVCVDEMIIVAITHMHSFRARHINSQEKRKTEKKSFPATASHLQAVATAGAWQSPVPDIGGRPAARPVVVVYYAKIGRQVDSIGLLLRGTCRPAATRACLATDVHALRSISIITQPT